MLCLKVARGPWVDVIDRASGRRISLSVYLDDRGGAKLAFDDDDRGGAKLAFDDAARHFDVFTQNHVCNPHRDAPRPPAATPRHPGERRHARAEAQRGPVD